MTDPIPGEGGRSDAKVVGERSNAAWFDRADLIGMTGRVLAAGAVMLPVAGFVVRWVAFSSSPVTAGVSGLLAWNAPLGQLATTGLQPVVISLSAVLFAGVVGGPPNQPEPNRRTRVVYAEVALFVLATAFVWVLSPWPLLILLVSVYATALILALLARRWRGQGRRVTLTHGGWLVLPLLIIGTVGFGFGVNPDGTTIATYTFSPSPGIVANGRYIELAETATVVFLQKCPKPSSVESVNFDEILLRTNITNVTRDPSPTVFGLLFQGEPLDAGYRPTC